MFALYVAGMVILVLLAAVFIGRFFAWLLVILARLIFGLDISLDTFGLFSVSGIVVNLKNGLKIEIEKICLHNRWTLKNSKRLFTILFRSVILEVQKTSPEALGKHNLHQAEKHKSSRSFVVTHKQTISKFIRKLCKYVGLQVSSLEVLVTGQYLHGLILKFLLRDGLELHAISDKNCLSSMLTVHEVVAQFFVRNEDQSVTSSEMAAELSFSLQTEASFTPLESLLLATVYTNLKDVNVLVLDGLIVRQQAKAISTNEEEEQLIVADVEPVTSSNVLTNLSKIPKNVELAVDGVCIKFLSAEKRQLLLGVSKVVTTLSQESAKDSLDTVESNLSLGLSGISTKDVKSCRVCTLNRLRLTAKLSCRDAAIRLATSLSAESFHYNHTHDEFSYWLEYFKSRRKRRDGPDRMEAVGLGQRSKYSILSRLPVELEMTNFIEVVDCSASLFLSSPLRNEQPLCRVVLGSFTVNLKIAQPEEYQVNITRELSSSARLENSYLFIDTSRRLQEGAHSTLGSNPLLDNPALLPSSTKHVWGRVLALGSCSIQLTAELSGNCNKPAVIKTVGEASSLAVEWSHDVCQALLSVVSCLELSSKKATPGVKLKKTSVIDTEFVSVEVEFRVSGVNLFYLGTVEGGVDSFMTRIDMALVTVTAFRDWLLKCALYEIKICRLLGWKKLPYSCVHSAEVENHFVTIPVATVSYSVGKETTVSLNEVFISWDPTLHMAIHDRLQELKGDGTELKALLKPPLLTSVTQEKQTLEVNFKCDISWFKLQMQTSSKTRFGVECGESSVTFHKSVLEFNSESTSLLFDDHRIFEFEVISVKKLHEVEHLQKLRQDFEHLETQSNKTWVIEAKNTRFFLPFMFNLAASREELVNVTKMLRTLHRKPKDPSYLEPLPSDLWLRFENIVLEMEDDPFEVKLRDNYALLLDEMEQRTERQQLLEAKLDEIRKRPGNLLTVKKEEELQRSLKAKNSQIYTRRSQTLYEQTPMRTTLLTWEFQGLDLIALADESYHGQEKAVRVMKQLNSDSPYPSTGLEFTTLWCRTVQGKLASHKCRLRDFPQPIFTSQSVQMRGTLLGAEIKATERAKREAVVEIDPPWNNLTVSRSLNSLKFFYDLKFDMGTMEMAWGVDIEPVTTMVSLAFEKLSSPSRDPSKPLPFFDKMRLLYHGRLRMAVAEWHLYLSASRDPYDTTERMEWEWTQVNVDWTTGRVVIDGDFDLHTRAASKYDDRRVLHLPAFRVCFHMKWHSQGNAMDHHSVSACAPDKVPELAPNQVHDSYAAFRSQSLTLDISLETAMGNQKDRSQSDPPTLFMYASTFRWFQKYQAVVFRYVSRPIRKGSYFGRDRVKKKSLGRHYKQVSLSLRFPELSVWYWGSFTQQRGFELSLGDGYLGATYCLTLRNYCDGLVRRPAADWSTSKFDSELSNVTCHLYGLEEFDGKENSADEQAEVSSIDLEPTKYYLLAASRLEYTRQDTSKAPETVVDGPSPELQNYNHRLVCHDLKGAWTLTNRCIAFGLFEAYTNAQVLKKNLSADALKFTIVDQKGSKQEASPGRAIRSRSLLVSNMLEKLVMEKDSKFVAFAEECTGEHEQVTETHLQGVALCTNDDVIEDRWHIELVNSQIMLRGKESEGCVLVTAGNTRILNRLHNPVWSKGELFNKKTWVGNVDNLQYFATIGSENSIGLDSSPWLSTSVITGRQNRNSFDIADLANIVGSGEAVGGMVSASVGSRVPGLLAQEPAQLQRIVARCSCEFYFVNFSADLDPVAEEHAPSVVPPSPSSHLHVDTQSAVNTFTIRHKLLEISTNSAQYAMLIDIAHNVVLYTEPKKKEASDKLQRMRFHLHLSTSEDQRGQILRQQNTVRSYQNEMRRLERELYEVNLLRKQAVNDQDLTDAVIELEKEISRQKKLLSEWSSDLQLMISAYKDFLMNLNTPTPEKAPSTEVTKLAEVYFNHASWQLTHEDGQLAIADASFSKFIYRKTTLSGATVEHRLELGRFHVRNLLPNSIYKDALSPLDLSGRGHVDRSVSVRIFCRVRPPVGGIGVKEHFEVNVCPLAVRLTYRLFKKVMVFFFPQRAHEYEGEAEDIDLGFRGMEVDVDEKDLFTFEEEEESFSLLAAKSTSLKRSPSSLSSASETSLDSSRHKKTGVSVTDSPPMSPSGKDKQAKKKSTFYKRLNEYDDLDKMKERASKNNTFIYVKIPQVSLLVSYKGEKDRNITDVHDFSLVIPTLEYHSRTWTWHDLLMAMKKDCVNVLVSQAIKEKLHLVGGHGTENKESKSQAKEEDKARLLWGDKQKDQQKKSKKRLFSKLAKVRRGSKRKGLLQPDGAGPEPVDLEEEEDYDELGAIETDGGQEDEAEGS